MAFMVATSVSMIMPGRGTCDPTRGFDLYPEHPEFIAAIEGRRGGVAARERAYPIQLCEARFRLKSLWICGRGARIARAGPTWVPWFDREARSRRHR